MKRNVVECSLASLYLLVGSACPLGAAAGSESSMGPLRVHPENRRYFADAEGRVVYLTGSHTWNNLQDMLDPAAPKLFDFADYLDFLMRRGHNFVRLWRWELLAWDTAANRQEDPAVLAVTLHPWARTGPGKARDGKPKFDLELFDVAYFQRLRSRVEAANARGIYVAIMLFEGWGMQFVQDAWQAHPFHPDNNVNGIDGDANGDGRGLEVHTLTSPVITALQSAYARKVVDTVNDLDNVLYEVSNENHPPSTPWQYHMISLVKAYEATKPKRHPVGMTFQYKGGLNASLFDSPADWVSPNREAAGTFDYRDRPPPAQGKKVVLSDTDHLWGIGGNVAWVWKTFLRGHNPIFMDPYDGSVLRRGSEEEWERVRRAMGQTRRVARRLDLARLTPSTEVASSGFCLADPGRVYVAWVPVGGALEIDLTGAEGEFGVEWVPPVSGATKGGGKIAGGGVRSFNSPFEGDAVLLLRSFAE